MGTAASTSTSRGPVQSSTEGSAFYPLTGERSSSPLGTGGSFPSSSSSSSSSSVSHEQGDWATAPDTPSAPPPPEAPSQQQQQQQQQQPQQPPGVSHEAARQSEEDGYKWRKYGRKSVKGSQYPRSYYKCTYPGCTGKKQVEAAVHNGKKVFHTTYKGEHTHDAPQVTRLNVDDQNSFKNLVMNESLWAASAAAAETIAKMATGAAHQSQNASADSGAASSQSLPAGPTPRLVVEARLGVDYRDDGYHWRKYGQKNVKGSDNPRSYYKCTEKDCPVKKQVEKNGDHTINTYEGTHNHLAPGLNGSILCRRRGKKKPQPHQEEEEEDGEEEEEEEDGEEEGEGVREGELGGGDDSAVHIPEASNGNGTCLLPARKRHKRPEDSGDSSAQMQPFPPSSHSSMHALLTASSSPSLSSVVIPPPQLIHDNQQQSSEPYWDRSNSQHHEQQQPQDASYMNTWWENKDRRDTSGLFNPHFSNLSTLYSALGTPAPTSSPLSSRFLPLTSAQPLPTSFQLSNSSASAFFSSPVIHSLLANTNSPFSSMHPSGSNGLPATPNTPGVLPQLMSLPSDSPLYQALAATLARTWPNDSVTERGSGDYNCETGGTGEKETQQGGSTTENSRAMQEGSSTGEQTPLMHQFYYPSFQPFPSSSLQQQSSSSVSLAPLPVIVYPTNHSSSPSSATPLQSTMGTSEGAAELLRINDDLTEMD